MTRWTEGKTPLPLLSSGWMTNAILPIFAALMIIGAGQALMADGMTRTLLTSALIHKVGS